MKLDLPTPGVPVRPMRSAGRARRASARQQRARAGAVVGAGRFDQRDRPGQRPPVAGRRRRRGAGRRCPSSALTQASSPIAALGLRPPLWHTGPDLSRRELTERSARCRCRHFALRAPLLRPRRSLAARRPAPRALGRTRPSTSILRDPRRHDVARHRASTATAYTARSRIEAAGLDRHAADLLLRRPGVAADRRPTARVVPSRFQAPVASRRAPTATSSIDWKNGTPVKVSVEPPRKFRAGSGASRAARSIRSRRAFALLRDRPADEVCDTTLDVFDGSRLSRLRLGSGERCGRHHDLRRALSRGSRARRIAFRSRREFPFALIFQQAAERHRRSFERIETDDQFRPGGAGAAELRRNRGCQRSDCAPRPSPIDAGALPALPSGGLLGRARRPGGAAGAARAPARPRGCRSPARGRAGRGPHRDAGAAAGRRAGRGRAAGGGAGRAGRAAGRLPHPRRGGRRAARIEVVTEGILTRMMQSDPELPGIGCVIFDEFHERALQADLGLALALEVRGRAAARPAAAGDVGDARRRRRSRR